MSRTRPREPGESRTPGPQDDAFHRQLVESAADLVYRVDAEGRLTYANPAVARLVGVPLEELMGKPFADLVRPDHREVVLASWSDGGATSRGEFPVVTASGDKGPAEVVQIEAK